MTAPTWTWKDRPRPLLVGYTNIPTLQSMQIQPRRSTAVLIQTWDHLGHTTSDHQNISRAYHHRQCGSLRSTSVLEYKCNRLGLHFTLHLRFHFRFRFSFLFLF